MAVVIPASCTRDDDGNFSKTDPSFPDLTITKPEVNVFGGVRIKINGNRLLIADEEVASWSDKSAQPCKDSLSFNGQEVKDGDTLSEAGKLVITITNRQERSSSAEITLTSGAVISLGNIDVMQVGVTTDLLQGVTLANGAELIKVELEMDGLRTEIADASHYMPDYPGTCCLIYTVKGKNGDTAEARAENLTIKAMEYKAIEISNINPTEILPILKNME